MGRNLLNETWRHEQAEISKYADHHIEKMYKTIEKHMAHCNKYIPIIGGDFNAELGPGKKNGM